MGIKPSKKLDLDSRSRSPVEPIHRPVTVSFRDIQAGRDFCLSHCVAEEVKEAMDCFRQLTTMSWMQLFQTSSKREKQGLAYTVYEDTALRGAARPARISPEVKIASIRGSRRFRIFGYHLDHVFYVLWFDREHGIVPV